MSKPFIHLRCLSSYSLSESTLKIKKLVSLAKKNNLPALAITDNLISGKTALAETPADTDELLVSDGGTLKRVDFSYII